MQPRLTIFLFQTKKILKNHRQAAKKPNVVRYYPYTNMINMQVIFSLYFLMQTLHAVHGGKSNVICDIYSCVG